MKQNEKIVFNFAAIEKTTEGKTKLGVAIRIAMKLGWIEKVRIIINEYGKEEEGHFITHVRNDDEYAYFYTVLYLMPGLYYYHFSLELNGVYNEVRYEPKTKELCITTKRDLPVWKLNVGFSVPKWAVGATMYHIFIDRYRCGENNLLVPMPRRTMHKNWDEKPVVGPNSDGLWNVDFYGGNLEGIEETLKYIKALGCSIIYISPIFLSQSNHRYDTSDYEVVDPYAGDNDSLKKLCTAAHKKGMHIIIDAVFNHVGNDSKYFNEYHSFNTIGAYEGEKSPYYKWFQKDEKGEITYWWGMKNLPVCDGNNEEWKNYICGEGGVIDKWFKLGIDGLRLDVADELTDDFIESIRIAVKRNKPDGFILGEVWKNPMRMNRKYLEGANGMDSVMNYLLADALIRYVKYGETRTLEEVLYQILMEYPETAISTLMNFTSTHDISRILNILGEDNFRVDGEWVWDLKEDCNLIWQEKAKELEGREYRKAKKLLKVYLSILAFIPGIFTIFYGDEAGVQGIGNLLNRKTYPWGKRDKDLVRFVRNLLKLRNNLEFLKKVNLTNYTITKEMLYLERKCDDAAVLVVANRSQENKKPNIPEEYKMAEVIFTTNNSTKDKIAPFSVTVLKK